jgi:hypothetical protein
MEQKALFLDLPYQREEKKVKEQVSLNLSKTKVTLIVISALTFIAMLALNFHWMTSMIFAFAVSGAYNALILLFKILRYAYGLAIKGNDEDEEMWD